MVAPQVEKIFVKLLHEGSDAWRPTLGEKLGAGVYRVLPTEEYDREGEEWEFTPGSVVKCEWRVMRGDFGKEAPCLVAVKEVSEP